MQGHKAFFEQVEQIYSSPIQREETEASREIDTMGLWNNERSLWKLVSL